jgi:hypothetical protein
MESTKESCVTISELTPVSNDAMPTIEGSIPYIVTFSIEGNSPMLFHRWSVEAIAEKAAAAKGSAAKKSDDVESYVWRLDTGEIGMPGEYVRQAVIHAAKFRQDPRSPRKSAMDLYKAAVVSLTDLASLGTNKWDFLDQRRVMVQRAGITRSRPGFHAGWRADFDFQVQLPEYVQPSDLLDVLVNAGRLVGVGDFRPTYGRFQVVKFDIAANG